MAPPPITATLGGISASDSTSSEVMTSVPSTSKPGMVRQRTGSEDHMVARDRQVA